MMNARPVGFPSAHFARLLPWLAGLFCALMLLLLPGRAAAGAVEQVLVATGKPGHVTLDQRTPYYRNGETAAQAGPVTDWNIYFDQGNQTLYLKDLSIAGNYLAHPDRFGDTYFGLLAEGDALTLDVQGTNAIAVDHPADRDYSRAVFLDCAVTVRGTGTLQATGGKATISTGLYFLQLTAEGGTLIGAGGQAPQSEGIYVTDSATLSSGNKAWCGADETAALQGHRMRWTSTRRLRSSAYRAS